MCKVTDILEFNKKFKSEEDCRDYLYQLRWKDGFSCFRCGSDRSVRGRTPTHKTCMSCGYEESITANTSFHRLKIPLIKAFGLTYRLVIPRRGSSGPDLAREYGISRKTAWTFAEKVRQAMVVESQDDSTESSQVTKTVDSIIICGGKKEDTGLQQLSVSLKYSGKPTTSKRRAIKAICNLPTEPSKTTCELHFGKFVKQNKDIDLWNFKTWLTGAHHRCSNKYVQQYLDQYFFRSHHRGQIDTLWHTVMQNLVRTKPASVLSSGLK